MQDRLKNCFIWLTSFILMMAFVSYVGTVSANAQADLKLQSQRAVVDTDYRWITRTNADGISMTLRYVRLADKHFDLTSVVGCVPAGMEAAPRVISENFNYRWVSASPLQPPGCYKWLPNPYDVGAKLNMYLGEPATFFGMEWYDGDTIYNQSWPLLPWTSDVDPGGRPILWQETTFEHRKVSKNGTAKIVPIPPSRLLGAPWSCKNWGFSPDGHRAGVMCTGGPPEKYKIKTHFCNADQTKCWWKSGKATRYGNRARVYAKFGYSWYGEGSTVYAVAPV